ncbi:hypothetical protein ASC78_05845 [Variovorax sp. Root318D1]|nr:hypothetical protein ASC78_05845 [Variovorax sp. Root318D1]
MTRQPASGLPLEAEVRAKDLELDESVELDESAHPEGTVDDEAQPGKGENAPGFLKRRNP